MLFVLTGPGVPDPAWLIISEGGAGGLGGGCGYGGVLPNTTCSSSYGNAGGAGTAGFALFDVNPLF